MLPDEEVAPSIDAEAMTNDVFGDQVMSLQLPDKTNPSHPKTKEAIHGWFFLWLLVASTSAQTKIDNN